MPPEPQTARAVPDTQQIIYRRDIESWLRLELWPEKPPSKTDLTRDLWKSLERDDWQISDSQRASIRVWSATRALAPDDLLSDETLLRDPFLRAARETQLDVEIGQFAKVFWDLPLAVRQQHWQTLEAQCAEHPKLKSWLERLERGLDFDRECLNSLEDSTRKFADLCCLALTIPPGKYQEFAREQWPLLTAHPERCVEALMALFAEMPAVCQFAPELLRDLTRWFERRRSALWNSFRTVDITRVEQLTASTLGLHFNMDVSVKAQQASQGSRNGSTSQSDPNATDLRKLDGLWPVRLNITTLIWGGIMIISVLSGLILPGKSKDTTYRPISPRISSLYHSGGSSVQPPSLRSLTQRRIQKLAASDIEDVRRRRIAAITLDEKLEVEKYLVAMYGTLALIGEEDERIYALLDYQAATIRREIEALIIANLGEVRPPPPDLPVDLPPPQPAQEPAEMDTAAEGNPAP